jgi:hypothetical protein
MSSPFFPHDPSPHPPTLPDVDAPVSPPLQPSDTLDDDKDDEDDEFDPLFSETTGGARSSAGGSRGACRGSARGGSASCLGVVLSAACTPALWYHHYLVLLLSPFHLNLEISLSLFFTCNPTSC